MASEGTSRIRDLDGLVQQTTERLRVTIEHHERLRDEAQKDVDRHDSMIRRCRAALEGLAAADGDVPEFDRKPEDLIISDSVETTSNPGGTA